MDWFSLVLCLANTALAAAPTPFSDRWTVQISGGIQAANDLARKQGFINLGQIGYLKDYFYFELIENCDEDATIVNNDKHFHLHRSKECTVITEKLKMLPEVGYVEQERLKTMESYTYYSPPTDPGWEQQWSLDSQLSDDVHDINVEPTWMQGINGSGVIIAIVDNGVEIYHEDIAPNYDSQGSWDFEFNDSNPVPDDYASEEAFHGTSCAGEVVMVKDNDVCGVGVAYASNIAALKFNLSAVTNAEKARMWSHMGNYIDIYSNSFGPANSGYVVDGPNHVLNLSLATAVQQGRNGRGSIFVVASGNGGLNDDSCAANGYASSIYTIAVGSADQHLHEALFDEHCAAKMVVTGSFNSTAFHHGNIHNQIYTTALNGKCNDTFTGTSASAPLVSAAVALSLQANVNLTWRDVQYLLAYTSDPNLTDSDFQVNGGGLKVSHKYGFGALDVEAMVTRARRWINVPHQLSYSTGRRLFGKAYPRQPYTRTFNITDGQVSIGFLEHLIVTMTVQVEDYNVSYGIENFNTLKERDNWTAEQERAWLNMSHPRRGDIQIKITSPSGTTSTLLPYRDLDFINDQGYEDWPFTSVQHWGEDPIGVWTLIVTYRSSFAHATVIGAGLTLYGTETIPQAVLNVPAQCDPACKRGCSGVGPNHCDACLVKRVSTTLECVDQCPEGTYLYKSRYCNNQDNHMVTTSPTTNSTSTTRLPLSTIVMIISGSAITGITLVITMTILTCVCCINRKHNQRRYVRLQFDDFLPTT